MMNNSSQNEKSRRPDGDGRGPDTDRLSNRPDPSNGNVRRGDDTRPHPSPGTSETNSPDLSTHPHDVIARRAYEIYLKDGSQAGHSQRNWDQAVHDIQQEDLESRQAVLDDPSNHDTPNTSSTASAVTTGSHADTHPGHANGGPGRTSTEPRTPPRG